MMDRSRVSFDSREWLELLDAVKLHRTVVAPTPVPVHLKMIAVFHQVEQLSIFEIDG
jgi:hypothetical protein